MSIKAETQTKEKAGSERRSVQPVARNYSLTDTHGRPEAIIHRAQMDPRSLTPQDVLQLQRTIGNRAASRLLLPVTPKTGQAGNSPTNETIQRFAFINEQQVTTVDPSWSPEMKSMVADSLIRNYVSEDEFKNHAAKNTDYLGNVPATAKASVGTWLRFSPTGINILGERHTEVQLHDVIPAVGTKSFIDEQLSSDVMADSSSMKKAYLEENEPAFKRFGIEKELDKRKFGAESLLAKMGFGLIMAMPYFQKKESIDDLKSKPGYYSGQPVQRYLKIAWGYSKDNLITVAYLNSVIASLPSLSGIVLKGVLLPFFMLATIHQLVAAQLDPFITSLAPEGYLGDTLGLPGNAGLFDPLAKFARAFTEVIVEIAALDPSSRLSDPERKKLLFGPSISETEKMKLFSDWREYSIEDNVKAAAQRGVRYAGMGRNHMMYLITAGLPTNAHTYDMVAKDILAFEALTQKLKKKAVKP
ncbi:MAG TPA: hypothetical protein VHY08_12855 [Bacillota bacterium]|nr:hypothetical protein [Bacillota bacterium]